MTGIPGQLHVRLFVDIVTGQSVPGFPLVAVQIRDEGVSPTLDDVLAINFFFMYQKDKSLFA